MNNFFNNNCLLHIYLEYLKDNYSSNKLFIKSKNIFYLNKNCYFHINFLHNQVNKQFLLKNSFKIIKTNIKYIKAAKNLTDAIITAFELNN